ncbi:chaperone protein DnaK [Medicago truncatula]|uniref:Chaperone protein DnaK n=1 Tax=Medicago truncatula TaxID=3880 RepID=A0A072U7J0_MEDTR|nr:chaperone protein DnaK [Medicago truncatula]
MIREAEKYKDEDMRHRKKVEARNALERYAYNMRDSINDPDVSSKLSSKEKENINNAVDLVFKWLEDNKVAEQTSIKLVPTSIWGVNGDDVAVNISDGMPRQTPHKQGLN